MTEQRAGWKDDSGKFPMDLIAPEMLEGVAEVLEHGRLKYGSRNWEGGMRWGRVFAAMMRHMWAWWRGEQYDPESGLPHLAHAACCVMFLMAYEDRGIGDDDRSIAGHHVPVPQTPPSKPAGTVYVVSVEDEVGLEALVNVFSPGNGENPFAGQKIGQIVNPVPIYNARGPLAGQPFVPDQHATLPVRGEADDTLNAMASSQMGGIL